MEKSIESIWKDGFINSKALVVPKVNDIYNKKSNHIIEKYEKMFQRNIWGIIIGASLLFIGSYFVGAMLAGGVILIMMLYVAFTAYVELQALKQIDKGQDSYTYLKSFKNWINRSIERYGKMYRVIYPVLLLTFYSGFWFSDLLDGKRQEVAQNTSDMIFGLHIYSTVIVLFAAILMSVFSQAIHRRDVKAIYGTVMKKLDVALAEMEELRA